MSLKINLLTVQARPGLKAAAQARLRQLRPGGITGRASLTARLDGLSSVWAQAAAFCRQEPLGPGQIGKTWAGARLEAGNDTSLIENQDDGE